MSDGQFTNAQLKTLATLPKISGSLSILGSGFIVLEFLRDGKKRGQIYHRLLLGMSSFDILASFFMAMSTWLAPSESDVVWAAGTRGTCQTQGFMITLASSSLLYNLWLAVYYVLVVGYSKRDGQLRRFEAAAHCCSVLLGPSLAAVGLVLGGYHPSPLWCVNGAGHSSFKSGAADRAANHDWLFLIAMGVLMWVIIFCVTFAMIWVFCVVRRRERDARKWRHGPDSTKNKLTRQVAAQAFWYSASFYITWTPTTVANSILATRGSVPFGFMLVQSILMPCQGLLNALVYLRPRYKHIKRKVPSMSLLGATKRVICKTLMFRRDDESEGASDDDGMNPAAAMEFLHEDQAEDEGSGPSGTPKMSMVAT